MDGIAARAEAMPHRHRLQWLTPGRMAGQGDPKARVLAKNGWCDSSKAKGFNDSQTR
jgi:hypothetical protein